MRKNTEPRKRIYIGVIFDRLGTPFVIRPGYTGKHHK